MLDTIPKEALDAVCTRLGKGFAVLDKSDQTLYKNQYFDHLDLPAPKAIILIHQLKRTYESSLLFDDIHVDIIDTDDFVILFAEQRLDYSRAADRCMSQLMAIHSETHDFKATLSRIAEIASCSAGWRWVAITRFLNKKGDVKVIGWWDKLGNYEQLDYNILGTPCQAVVNSEKLCFYQNVQEDFPNEPAFSKLNASSYMGITYRLNELSAGHIFFMHDKYVSESKRYFSEMLLKLISLFVGSQLELIDTQKQLGKAINEANRDALTNLYNRRAFDNDIQQAEQHYKDRFITDALLVFIDVNGMKTVNDKRGHNAGDHLLITIASLLTKIFRQEDKCYRFGGDEFAVLITGRTLEAAESLASRLAFLNTQLGDAGFEEASVCYGHCFLKDVQGDATTWLKTTDERLYTAKALWRTQQRATPVAQTE